MKRLIALAISLVMPTMLMIITTTLYHPARVWHLALFLLSSCSLISGMVIAYALYKGIKLDTEDYVAAAIFGSLFSTSVWWGMSIPQFLYYVPFLSMFIVALTFYLPSAAIYGAFVSMSRKALSSTLFFTIYMIASQIAFPNAIWIPYYIAWGSTLDLCFLLMDEKSRRMEFMGFLFGYIGTSLARSFMVVGWGDWKPLFEAIPTCIVNGLFSYLGFTFGYEVGLRASKLRL